MCERQCLLLSLSSLLLFMFKPLGGFSECVVCSAAVEVLTSLLCSCSYVCGSWGISLSGFQTGGSRSLGKDTVGLFAYIHIKNIL